VVQQTLIRPLFKIAKNVRNFNNIKIICCNKKESNKEKKGNNKPLKGLFITQYISKKIQEQK